MSVALESLATLGANWPTESEPEEVSARLRATLNYLRRCYGPTPLEAIASDEMDIAAAAITDIVARVPLEQLVSLTRKTKLPVPLAHWCISLALRAQYGDDYRAHLCHENGARGSFDVVVDGVVIASLGQLGANIYRTHFENDVLTVEAQVAPPFLFHDEQLSMNWVAWQTVTPAVDTGEYAGYHLFGHVFAKGRYLRLRTVVPPEYPKTTITLRAELRENGVVHTASMQFGYRGASHLAKVRGLRWVRGNFAFRADRRAIAVTRISTRQRVKNEMLVNIAVIARVINKKTPLRHLKAVVVRTLYWVTKSRWERKNVWLLHDKMYSASDCGEYMYWYLHKNRPEVTAVYAVNKDATEAPRLRKAGANLVYAGSIRLALYYLHAKVVFTTHPNPATTTGLTQFGPFLRDLNNAPIVCIQHGLSMQELGRSMHQGHAGIERYYCASRYEITNIGTPEYGYEPEQLVLTGIPRFDGLPVDSERVIMISPTWRPEYAAPSPGENNRRPANDDFLDSLYFERFSSLLTSKQLLDEAERQGFSIRFMIHPTLATNHEHFRRGLWELADDKGVSDVLNRVVSIGAAGIDTSYDEELKRARLLVTDYSGIQYDFAYMRKAIIYFHDGEMPPQYGDGAMDYPTMGFGPISRSIDALVEDLLDALRRGCQVEETYVDRYETFFEFNDRHSCQRIHEDVESWLNSAAKEYA